MNKTATTKHRSTARSLAPEDVRPGQYVIITQVVYEFLPYAYLFEINRSQPIELLRIAYTSPDCKPMRVVDVCLPVVVVKMPTGEHNTLDTRQVRLARVPLRFGRDTFIRLRRKRKRKKEAWKPDGDDDDD